MGSSVPQIFEQLETQGLQIGCISAMNAENWLATPAYFFPDPWTKTPTDGSWWSRVLSEAVSQAVNDNAQSRLRVRSIVHLLMGLARFARPARYPVYWNLARRSRRAPWRKALLLDLLLHDLHTHLFSRAAPEFSTLFLNAGAHIQHHYFFNARLLQDDIALRNPEWYAPFDEDPVAEMFAVYDLILGDYLALAGTDVIVATGLSQEPYNRVKFYYRLKDHAMFLARMGVEFKAVQPRMTRDFLVEFDSADQAKAAERRLEGIKVTSNGERLFGEIDNRGSSLFVTMTYPHEVTPAEHIKVGDTTVPLAPLVAFVAIKNGMHQSKGFAFFTSGIAPYAPPDGAHVKELNTTIKRFFGLAPAAA
ncbi:MAG: hypothetical protein KIS62_06250 [Ramlibacter sp.]|nr:hypothetical protein [Ramlibacter sp.]